MSGRDEAKRVAEAGRVAEAKRIAAAGRIAATEETRRIVEELVSRYRRNAEQYGSAEYKEAQVRQEFIDPFFGALGWDMANEQGFAEQYKDVVHEPSIRIGEETKAPDYSFRIGGQRKFFLEAKKPSVRVKDDPGPAYQLRRYAWSAKLPLSVLTDFEEFAVYDCRKRPKQEDSPSVARVDFIRYEDYLDRLDDMYAIFAKEAILKGSFDRYVEKGKGKRGTTEVDAEFLKEIEAWRELLAKDIAKNNADLSVHDLNHAVQATIDRILFFRMAEDRGVEEYGRLRGLVEGSKLYASLCDLYREADEKYNAGLFDFSESGDTLCPRLTISDKALKGILSKLYYPECPYEFSVLGADILGAVYEQFLGKVIRLTPSHRAKVEEKPEVKKAGGVYYTPTYIVNYIVKHTVGEALEEAGTPKKAAKLRILDPACGSGSFLLGAYEYLLRWHLDYYSSHSPKKHARGKEPAIVQIGERDWRLSTSERKRILQNNVYGVDIDAQAVEVTKLNLLLKCMEGETSETIDGQLRLAHERVLPNIDENIKCGNSLIGPDYYSGRLLPDPDEMRRVNPFDWERQFEEIMKAGGFDCVIGNPPYVRIQNLTEFAPEQPPYFKEHYRSASKGNYDIYVVFAEKGLELLNSNGKLGFILPNKFAATDYGAELRALLTRRKALRAYVDFQHYQVFETATTYTCLLFLRTRPSEEVEYLRPPTPRDIMQGLQATPLAAFPDSPSPWSFADDAEVRLVEKLVGAGRPLIDLPASISRGSSTGDDMVFILSFDGASTLDKAGAAVSIEPQMLRTPLFATDFGRYRFAPHGDKRIIFPYVRDEGNYRLLPEAKLKTDYPMTYAYLRANRAALDKRKQSGAWYGYSAPRNLALHESADLLVPLLADKGSFCALSGEQSAYCLMASGGFSFSLSGSPHSPLYVLGLLNSSVLYWRLKNISNVFRAGWITCTKQYVGTLPIRTIDFDDAGDVGRHDRMVGLVERMLELHERLAKAKTQHDRELLERQIAATDREIDELVYELYELTDEEIGIVEEATRRE